MSDTNDPPPGKTIKVYGDGSCLYHAVIAALDGKLKPPHIGKDLCKRLYLYIRNNQQLRSKYPKTIDTILARVRNNAWGENEEVEMLSRMLNKCIIVYTIQDGKNVRHVYDNGEWIFPPRQQCTHPALHLINLTGTHYDARIPEK